MPLIGAACGAAINLVLVSAVIGRCVSWVIRGVGVKVASLARQSLVEPSIQGVRSSDVFGQFHVLGVHTAQDILADLHDVLHHPVDHPGVLG